MLILNFAHPLTEEHLVQIERLTGQKVERVIVVNSQIDPQQLWRPRSRPWPMRPGFRPRSGRPCPFS